MPYTNVDNVEAIFQDKRVNLDADDKSFIKTVRDVYADPIIDAKLSDNFDTPFKDHPDTPKIITAISTWITAYLFQTLPTQTTDQEWIQRLWDRGMELLDQLRDGEASIPELEKQVAEDGFTFDKIGSESNVDHIIFADNVFELENFGNYERNIKKWID